MGWRDQLLQAQFRGVQFHVQSHEGQFGRRSATHEYPKRDTPYVEDLGRKTRELTIEAFVLGADYMTARDKLLDAIEQPGLGTLVHPYLGSLVVAVTQVRLRESTEEGGIARFSITFIESGAAGMPQTQRDTKAAVKDADSAVMAALMSQWLRSYSVGKKPEFVVDEASALLGDTLAAVQSAAKQVAGKVDEVAALARDIQDVTRDLISVIYTPASVAQALVANIKQLVSNVTDAPRDAFGLARVFYRFGDSWPDVTGATASRRQQADNQAAFKQVVRTTAVSQGAVQAASIQFDSYQDAIGIRDELIAVIDDIAEAPDTGDDLYQALRALRTAVVRDIAARGGDLARLVAYTPAKTMPALVLAHRLYGDATRADEIVARNRIRHPGFVPGAQALEVLSDA